MHLAIMHDPNLNRFQWNEQLWLADIGHPDPVRFFLLLKINKQTNKKKRLIGTTFSQLFYTLSMFSTATLTQLAGSSDYIQNAF